MSYPLSFMILLAPFFSNYVLFGPISIGDLFVFAAVLFLAKEFRITIFNLVLFLAYSCLVFIALYVLYDHGVDPGFFRISFYCAVFLMTTSLRTMEFGRFIHVYVGLSIFFSASLILQWLIYQFLHITIPLQLPLPYYEADTLVVIEDAFRTGGWFKEPSYFAIFITPVLFYLISSKAYLKFFLVALAGVVSTSSLAIFIILLSVLLFFIKTRREWLRAVFLLPIFLATVFYVLNSFSDLLLVSRFISIFVDGGTLIDRVGPIFDIIVLSQQAVPDPAAHQLVVSGGDTGIVWYSSFAYILGSLGWMGIAFMVPNFFRLGKIAGIVILALLLSAHIFSGVFSFFIALAFLAVNSEQKRGEYISRLSFVPDRAHLCVAES